MLFDFPFVEFGLVMACIACMFGIGGGEVVRPAEIGIGAHIQIVVLLPVEHGIHGGCTRNTDRSGRQARIFVCIIRRVNLQVLFKNTPQSEVLECEFHSGTGLQRHILLQTVDIQPCDNGIFRLAVAFLLDNGSDGCHLGRRKRKGFCLFETGSVPEMAVFLLHPLEQSIGRDVPIEFVGVGYEKGNGSRCVESVMLHATVGFETGDDVQRVEHELRSEPLGELRCGADVVERDLDGGLLLIAETAYYIEIAKRGAEQIAACFRL